MKTLYKFFSTAIILFFINNANGQNTFPARGSVGIGTTIPDTSSLLEIKSIQKGVLIPRMTLARRDIIALPATGLLIYQTNNTPGFYYYTGTVWTAITPKPSWSLTGNAATNPATNFIGTTDLEPLIFRVNNQKAGYLDYKSDNTGFGVRTLTGTTGGANTANGYNALYTNTSGFNNTANGAYVLYSNSKGHNNTANGYRALFTNTTGYYNAATGAFSLENNIGGIGNTANGISALRNNTNGSDNTATGANTLYNNTTGYSNVAVGSNALFKNTTASHNVAVGDSALYNKYGDRGSNTAVGSKALYSNTTGYENTASGYQALYNNTDGYYNTANGDFALFSNTTGHENTAIGKDALGQDTKGSGNTAIGKEALSYSISSDYNTAVGYQTAFNFGDFSYSSAFGAYTEITASDQVRIGASDIMSIGGYQSWTTLPSDKRVKKNIKENVPGLAFINKLKPVTYNLDLNAIDKILQRPIIRDKDGKTIQPSQQESDSRKAKEQILFTGFVAQDVAAAASSINYDFSGVDMPKNDKDIYGLRYSDFVVPLVKAVQELSAKNDELGMMNDELKKQNDAQQNINIDLQNRLGKLEAMMNVHQSTTNLSSASLDQNVPNPFSNTTTISYSLPQNFTSAQIIITDKAGKVLKQATVSGSGKGFLQLNASAFSSSSYQYSLLVDGKLIDTKQMVLAK